MAGIINAMAMRQAVMANTPHMATASGSTASFSTDMVGKLRHLVVGIEPEQAGSGDPSPENIRPITGWTGLTLNHSGADTSNPDTLNISWESEAGTVYGATIDVVTGVLTVERETINLGTLAWVVSSNDGQFYSETNFHAKPQGDALCSTFLTGVYNAAYHKTRDNSLELRIGTKHRTWVYSTIYAGMSSTAFKTAMNGVQLVYELATPITYQLSPTMVKSLIGTNHVWADTGDVESLTYWTH